MKHVRLYLALFFLCFPGMLHSADVREYFLANGLKILIAEEHKSPVATFQVWYRVGSRDEPLGKSGLGHLLEHMMFKGTSRYGPSQLSALIQKNGGTTNAYTTKDHTVYFALLSADRIGLAVDLEADRMQNLLLDPRELLAEKDVVMEERRLRYEDDPQNSLFEDVVSTAFKVHPYQRPVIGWMTDLRSILREDVYAFYKTYYNPRNAVIVVAGDVNSEDMVAKIRDAFQDIPPSESGKRLVFEEPEQRGERRVVLKRDAELPFLIVAYRVPSFPHEDSYALDVLRVLLSAGKSSRLYQSLVYEKKIALSAAADYNGFTRDPFLFFLYATVSPGVDVKDVEQELYREIERIQRSPPSDGEVQKAKNQIESSFIIGQDSIYVQAMKIGSCEMLGDWRLMDRYLEGIRKVTPADVVSVATKYLGEDNRTVGILTPTKEPRSEK